MSDTTAQGASSGVPFYKSTKKTLGVIGVINLYLVFDLMVVGWLRSDMNGDLSAILQMAVVVATTALLCLGIKTFGGVLNSRVASGESEK